MKSIILSLLICTLLSVSCSTEIVPEVKSCELDAKTLVVEPFCSFNPKFHPDVNFPVHAILDGENASSYDFGFSWSSDLEFGGSAISISYDKLPLELEITEYATDCTKIAILEKSYWD